MISDKNNTKYLTLTRKGQSLIFVIEEFKQDIANNFPQYELM